MKKLTIAVLLMTFISCAKKDDPKPEPLKATYVCYSESGRFTIKYITSSGWVTERILSNRATRTFDIDLDQLQFITQVISDTVNVTDSLHIDGFISGKVVSVGHRSRIVNSMVNLNIQLSNAQ